MNKRIALNEIIDFLDIDIKRIFGEIDDLYITNLSPSDAVNLDTLDWINPAKKNAQYIASSSKAKAIIVGEGINYTAKLKKQRKVLIVVDNPKLAIARIGNAFFIEKIKCAIHPSSVIHSEAIIGKNVFIGANATIGKCKIGDNCKIYPNVIIYDRTTVGNNVVIHAGAVICTDGLGCQRGEGGELIEFPKLGGVVIEDNIYIGSNTHIASGTLSDTIIGKGSKINGLCFIGSNCKLGTNVWITGSTMLAGSVTVGNNVSIFSKVIVRDHCNIGDKATIGMGSVVTKNIPKGETWVGNPAKKIK